MRTGAVPLPGANPCKTAGPVGASFSVGPAQSPIPSATRPRPPRCWSLGPVGAGRLLAPPGGEFREGGAAGCRGLETLGADPIHPELAEAPPSGSTRPGEAPWECGMKGEPEPRLPPQGGFDGGRKGGPWMTRCSLRTHF